MTLASPSSPTSELVHQAALAEGFDAVRVVRPDAIPEAAGHLRDFIKAGRHGDMDWLATHAARREDPRHLWPEVKSIIMLGLSYGPETNPLDILDRPDRGGISVYAQGRDYHDVVKKKLKRLARRLLGELTVRAEDTAQVKVFVDTAPVMEKPLAAAAGLGWQGKHTNLVSRDFGSWLFLGSIFTTVDIPPDAPTGDHCGSCQACLDICPTDAFPAPYQLDARRCISYLTIEAKEQIPQSYRSAMGNRIYGCDDCLAVCPWNKYAQTTREAKLAARTDLQAPALAELVQLDDTGFRALFSGSPVKRTGRDRFVRNVLVAIGNAQTAPPEEKDKYLPLIEARLEDMSDLVRGMAVWALGQYLPAAEMRIRAAAALGREQAKSVCQEWEAFL